MRRSGITILATALGICTALAQSPSADLTRYVDPFLGTGGHGHTYPGATVPFGMVQLSPDNGQVGWDWCSGYHYSDSIIVGFSHTHLSGTGCADLGDIGFLPGTSPAVLERGRGMKFSHDQESAEPGYYRVKFPGDGILVELTATDHAGFHRYTYPLSDTSAVLIDLKRGQQDDATDTRLVIKDPTLVTGYRFSCGWAPDQHLFFAARFSQPIVRAVMVDTGSAFREAKSARGTGVRAVLLFGPSRPDRPLLVKVGLSSSSEEGAVKNLDAEIHGWGFDAVRKEAHTQWEKELGKVKIKTPDEATKTVFYSALYHAFLAPTEFSDVDGTYRGADGKQHDAKGFKYYSTYSLWDTYRAAHPLYTILQPERVNGIMASMLAFANESGYLPVWQLAANETNCMVGYHAVPPLVDAYLKGFRGFDANGALAAMVKSATRDHRGLRYYSTDAPAVVMESLAGEKKSPALEELSSNLVSVSGYAKTLSGDSIHYHSSDPTVEQALIVRASDGKHAIEWSTDAIPSSAGESTRGFIWMAGIGSAKGAHPFILEVNGDSILTFKSAMTSADRAWSVEGKGGSRLSFAAQFIDDFGDLFGNMILTLPSRLAPAGASVTLRMVGSKGETGDWVMTFEHPLRNVFRVRDAYGLVHRQGKELQVLRVDLEHLGPTARATIFLGEADPVQTDVIPGQSTVYVPIPVVAQETPMSVRIEGAGMPSTAEQVSVRPMRAVDYVPADKDGESVSKSLEYAIDDFCISTMAKAMGKGAIATTFAKRGETFRNLFDASTGFFRGRNLDGSWVTPFNPRFSTAKQPEYTEGNAWQYLWLVPQDVKGLIDLLGGRDQFDIKLDSLFNQSSDLAGTGASADVSGLIGLYAQGNEPSHHIAYLYDYDGHPWKTQETVHRIMTEFYKTGTDGLCGNEDCGQMSSWYLFSALGFYPVTPVGGVYAIGSPLVSHAVINVGHGKTFTVDARGLTANNFYIQSAKLNGKTLDRPWITHQDLLSGGTLTLVMGSAPNKQWGSSPSDAPPTLPTK